MLFVEGQLRTFDAAGAETWRSAEVADSRFPDLRGTVVTTDARTLAVATRHHVVVFDVDHRREIARIALADDEFFQAMAVSPDHRRLAILAKDVLRLHELPGGAPLEQLDLTTDAAGHSDVAFTGNDEMLVLSRERLFLWHLGEHPQMRALRHAVTLHWSPTDDRLYVGLTNGTVNILTRATMRDGMRRYLR